MARSTGDFSILLCHIQLPHAPSSDLLRTYDECNIFLYLTRCSVQSASARRAQIKSCSRILSTYVKWFTRLADWSYFLFLFSLIFPAFFLPFSFYARKYRTPAISQHHRILHHRYIYFIYIIWHINIYRQVDRKMPSNQSALHVSKSSNTPTSSRNIFLLKRKNRRQFNVTYNIIILFE